MDDVKLADLNDIQDFFNRVDSAHNSTSPIEKPHSKPIDVKDFIGWCNDPRESVSKSPESPDDAATLSNAIVALNQFGNSELDAMESALKEGRWDEWRRESELKASADDAIFYLVLKHRTDDQGHYHFYFDKDTVAVVDAFSPFTEDENGRQVLDQQWHVLISLLAYLDVAHALSNEQHEYHCLYPYLSRYDKGDLNKRYLRLGWEKERGKYCRALEVVKNHQDNAPMKRIGRKPYHSGAMMEWIEKALTGKLASERPR